jgi:diguanylate cyclase (GGDEF)-like protein
MDDAASETIEFRTLAQDKPEYHGRSYCLIVMAGPDKGATFPLNPGVTTIGRSPDSVIVLNGRGISRHHAVITLEAKGEVFVEDVGSTNGLYIDGQRIIRQALEPGQTLILGPEVILRLELSAPGVQTLLQEMHRSAILDQLTGLLNRRGFEERLEVEYAMVRRHRFSSCLAILDLDHFKAVNDSEGHDAGDLVLQALGELLKGCVRVGDLACRWGGEEFTLYIRQTPLAGGTTMLDRLRESFAETPVVLPSGGTLRCTFSGGVVDLLEFEDWKSAFRKADEALYLAKREGRNRIKFYTRGF